MVRKVHNRNHGEEGTRYLLTRFVELVKASPQTTPFYTDARQKCTVHVGMCHVAKSLYKRYQHTLFATTVGKVNLLREQGEQISVSGTMQLTAQLWLSICNETILSEGISRKWDNKSTVRVVWSWNLKNICEDIINKHMHSSYTQHIKNKPSCQQGEKEILKINKYHHLTTNINGGGRNWLTNQDLTEKPPISDTR